MKVVCDCRKDARLPVQLQRAMAAEAEAAREARAKVRIFKIFIDLKSSQSLLTIISFLRLMRFHVRFDGLLVISKQKKLILAINFFQVIAAEGEQKASKALREASEVIAESSSALQLRYLQVNIFVP